jgi:serine/threonine protein kinase
MFSYDPKKRPTLDEIKNHPWMKKPFNFEQYRKELLIKVQEAKESKRQDSINSDERDSKNKRGGLDT